MKWFEGSINEAVTTAKAKKAIFVVFIAGKDTHSVEFSQLLDTSEISSLLEQPDFVAIRLESGSESYRFFVQIYQLVPVPSLFFIGDNGAPLEIIAGNVTATDLTTKINSILAKANKPAKASSVDLIQSEQAASAAAGVTKESDIEVNTVDRSEDKAELNAEAKLETPKVAPVSKEKLDTKSDVLPITEPTKNTESINKQISESTSESPTTSVNEQTRQELELTTEEKVERARKLIELQKMKRAEEEMQKSRERELERRKTGRDMQQMKQKQQDLEIKQAQEERLREKAAEAAARERVKQQIAQDRLDRKQRELTFQQQNAQQQTQPLEQPRLRATSSSDSTVARIQFKLPTGNPHMGLFDVTSTLGILRTYVVENIELPFPQFEMSTSFPRRELSVNDDDKTLQELELVPTSVILILPLKNASVVTNVSSGQDISVFSRFIWTLFYPVISMYNYAVEYFSGRPRRPLGRQDTNSARSIANNIERSVSAQATGRNLGNQGISTIRAEGNVHRLYSGGDQDDENNTWNGNSTQQM